MTQRRGHAFMLTQRVWRSLYPGRHLLHSVGKLVKHRRQFLARHSAPHSRLSGEMNQPALHLSHTSSLPTLQRAQFWGQRGEGGRGG